MMEASTNTEATVTHLKETISRLGRPEPPKGPEMFDIGLEAGHAKRLHSLDEAMKEEQYKKQNKVADAGHAMASILSGISKGYAHDVASASAAASSPAFVRCPGSSTTTSNYLLHNPFASADGNERPTGTYEDRKKRCKE